MAQRLARITDGLLDRFVPHISTQAQTVNCRVEFCYCSRGVAYRQSVHRIGNRLVFACYDCTPSGTC